MLVIDVMVRSIFWKIVKQMSHIVQKASSHKLRRSARLLRRVSGLQSMFQLRDGLFPVAGIASQSKALKHMRYRV
jgi:hypothetical protein